MRIVLNGVETKNKGAELMFYAILQEIERKFPDAEVYIPFDSVKEGLHYIQTSLKLKYKPYSWLLRLKLRGILRRLGVPAKYCDFDTYPIKNTDYFIDASGFTFSDQWNHSPTIIEHWQLLFSNMKKSGAKLVFLPQAFGPIERQTTKREIENINQYADLIMPRDKVSLKYLQEAGVNPQKIQCFSDFTNLVEGIIPKSYTHLVNGICIIPNMRMIDRGIIERDKYIQIIKVIVELCKQHDRTVYMLNHEGLEDANFSRMCSERLGENIEVVNGLNALEIKGLISTSYLCISSRFHGVASALNSCVPCLATSWSHKYKELFQDYGMTECVLDLTDIKSIKCRISNYLSQDVNSEIRAILAEKLPEIKKHTLEMWDSVWK